MISALLIICCSAAMEVNLAPDQPLPFVYMDDPLIVEIVPDVDTEATLHISVQRGANAAPVIVSAGPVRLRAHGPYWWAVKDLPPLRGHYQAKVRVESPAGPFERDLLFCRIDRPEKTAQMPVCASVAPGDAAAIAALRNAGVRAIRIDAAPAEFDAQLVEALRDGFSVAASFDAAKLDNAGARAEAVAKSSGDRVARWDIHAANAQQLVEVADAIRRGGSTVPIALVISGAGDVKTYFESGSASHVRELALETPDITPDTIAQVLHAARRTGVEHWRFHAVLAQSSAETLVRDALRALGSGCASVVIPAAAVYDGNLSANFGRLNGLSRRMNCREAAGALSLAKGATGYVLRDHNQWLAALWAESAGMQAVIPVGKAGELRMSDAYGNVLEAPTLKDGSVTLSLGPEPVYLSGTDGDVLGKLARSHFTRQARALLAAPEYEGTLPPELLQRVRDVAEGKQEAIGRAGFLFLLRAFPVLEQAWHQGALAKEIAAPALGELADLMRTWCTIQEETGEPFVTPMSDHMEKCEEYRALYLTGAEAGERGDWLLDEVLRLMNEADALAHAGKAIEGTALVAMAEWRARALDSAAKAPPLSEPVDQEYLAAAPPETVAAAPVETAVAAPAATQPAQSEATRQETAKVEATPAEPEKIEHVVARGDNPSIIANKYNVGLEDLLRWNNLTTRSRLQIGDKLVVYPSGGAPETVQPQQAEEKTEKPAESAQQQPQSPKGKKTIHTVKRGDNPSAIAKKYGVSLDDFMRWNNLTKRTTLHIGQELVVYLPARRR